MSWKLRRTRRACPVPGDTPDVVERWNCPDVRILLGLLITAATGLFLLWLSARVFRAALLLYGQRMGLRSVWKALREAN